MKLLAIATATGLMVLSVLPALANTCDRSSQPATPSTIEVVRYQLADGVTDAAHRDAAAAITPFLCAQPGFVSRVLSKGDDGAWIDVIEWENATLAGASAERAQSEPSVAPFLQSINFETMDFRYLDIQQRID